MIVLNFRLFKISPDIFHLKAFGCVCFGSTILVHGTKFDAEASPCVFIGYSVLHKGYKVLDISTDKVSISRDVKFHEMNFPFHLDKENNLSSSSFPTAIYLSSVTTLLTDDYSSDNPVSIATDQYNPNSSADSLRDTSTDLSQNAGFFNSFKEICKGSSNTFLLKLI